MRMNHGLFVVVVLLHSVSSLVVAVEEKTPFERLVRNVASAFHSNWRSNFLVEHPHTKNRFKLTTHGHRYAKDEFVYPMILTIGASLVHRNLKVARDRSNHSLIYVDVLNLSYDDLPEDWAGENRATARVACRELLRALRRRANFDRPLIERIAEQIHRQWIVRNQHRTTDDALLLPYDRLPELEKDKDRDAILIACRLFNQLHFYRTFRTLPIALCQ